MGLFKKKSQKEKNKSPFNLHKTYIGVTYFLFSSKVLALPIIRYEMLV